MRQVLEQLLRTSTTPAVASATVLSASDGAEGLGLLRAEQPEVVITDLVMPNVDGFQLCRAVRDDPRTSACQLVVMSAVHTDPAVITQLKNELGVEFFSKPLQLRELGRCVQARFGPNGAPEALRAGATPAATTAVDRAADSASGEQLDAAWFQAPHAGRFEQRSLPRLLLECHEAHAT